jgi:hypothetical protein
VINECFQALFVCHQDILLLWEKNKKEGNLNKKKTVTPNLYFLTNYFIYIKKKKKKKKKQNKYLFFRLKNKDGVKFNGVSR